MARRGGHASRPALAQVRRDLGDHIGRVRFAQFLFFRRWERLKKYAHANGVRLIGDLPFFVSPDSSDVWANPALLLLDERRRPRVVAGVPPDYFSAQGQLWGNPLYDWIALRRTGFRFAFDGHADNPHLPHHHVPNAVVYTGTHDNPTTRAWFEALSDDGRRLVQASLKTPAGEPDGAAWALMRLAWSSAPALAIAPLQICSAWGKRPA